MASPLPQLVVTGRHGSRVTVRVQSLLKNEALGESLATRWPSEVDVRLATGTVRVQVTPDRDENAWLKALREHVGVPRRLRPAATTTRSAPSLRQRIRRDAPRSVSVMDAEEDAPHAVDLAKLTQQLAGGQRRRRIDPRSGLTRSEAARRLALDGPNEIRDVDPRTAWQILAGQFNSVPVGLLGASAAVSLASGALLDAGAIAAVLSVNGAVGFMTEREAEQTVSSLRRLQPGRVTVVRSGKSSLIDARQVVVGDVLVLQPGEAVAADARVLDAHRLSTNEAALTGESLPVRKQAADSLPSQTPLAERSNMVFLGTVVSGGVGRAVVVATGEHTEIGRIRRLAEAAQPPRTRLEQELDSLGRRLAVGAGLLCVGVFALGLLRGRAPGALLRTAVSLGVAAIPEGLPTVATSLLASSVRQLQRREIYVRKLDAIENLGAVDVVCFDKTGTLTQNRMSVASVTRGLERLEPGENGRVHGLPPEWLSVAVLCNAVNELPEGGDSEQGSGGSTGSSPSGLRGSSTELALLDFALAQGADAQSLRASLPVVGVRHRSEHHPYMVTMHAVGSARELFVAVKGRPDEVLKRCTDWFDGDTRVPLKPIHRRRLLALNDQLAGRGERVLALACRSHTGRRRTATKRARRTAPSRTRSAPRRKVPGVPRANRELPPVSRPGGGRWTTPPATDQGRPARQGLDGGLVGALHLHGCATMYILS